MSRVRVVCLVGPTGAGKSALALELARRHNGVIVNADSRQVYRDFPIITAQPGADDLALCPHRLYGWLPTNARITAGRWAELARAEIEHIIAAGQLPIVVGGTGLYVRALFDGMADIPPVDPAISARWVQSCAERGPLALHEELARVDPICAARIHPNDRQRIVRALEVFEASGKPLSWWQARTPDGPDWDIVRLAPQSSLDELTPRLAARIEAMLAHGAREEAEAARAICPDGTAPGWTGIGCAELFAWMNGHLDEAALRSQWLHNTRAYAKRQLTWFRADTRIVWYDPATACAEKLF